jgi:hypothetical protein
LLRISLFFMIAVNVSSFKNPFDFLFQFYFVVNILHFPEEYFFLLENKYAFISKNIKLQKA